MPYFDEQEKEFEIAPEGPHIATLVKWTDRGMQEGKFGYSNPQVGIQFELPAIETKNGEPMLVFFTVWNALLTAKSKGKPSYHDMCNALMNTEVRGMHMHTKELLGKSCRVTIVHNDSADGSQTYANIASFRPLKSETEVPEAKTEFQFFSLDPRDVPDMATLDAALAKLSQSERDKVQKSISYADLRIMLKHVADSKGKPARDIINDDLPENLSGKTPLLPHKDYSGDAPF